MLEMIGLLFWFSAFMIVYPYFIYPLFLLAVSAVKNREGEKVSEQGHRKVTLIISAYNEETSMEDKILNSLSLDYPRDLLEIMVVSDGSTDGTDKIVRAFSKRGVVLKRYEGRIGKSSCLNRAVPEAAGEIIVFTDANSMLDPHSVKRLVRHFDDSTVGFVTGGTRYRTTDETAGVGFYSRLEALIKALETRTGSCVGADGALFAVRKGLYTTLSDTDINDLVIPLKVISQGFRGVYEPEAFTEERTSCDAKGEFNRQVRITTRTIRALLSNAALMNPLASGLFSFKLVSHKLMRLVVPLFMATVLVANALIAAGSAFYMFIFALQLLFYLLAIARYSGYRNGSRLFSVPYTFLAVNTAILKGWIKYLRGETFITWQPAR